VLALATLTGRFLQAAFSNVELAAFLSALLTLLWLAAGSVTWALLRHRARLLLASMRRGPKLAALAAYWGAWLLLTARALGLTQLDRGLAVSAAAALLGFGLGHRLGLEARRVSLLSSLLVVLVAASWAGRSAEPSPFSLMARHGSWSKAAVQRGRALLDRDGDGHSPWLGGGDCDDRDPRVHPGAAELARDGLDNDCTAGDALTLRQVAAHDPSFPLLRAVPERPHLVLVTIETWRPDHLSLLGYARPTTPRLVELGQSSLVFERVYAAAPGTRLSLAALLSGRSPSSLRWHEQAAGRGMRHLSPENPWLPAALQAAGYRTLAVHTNFRAFTAAENAGFDRGFEVYDTSTKVAFVGGTLRGFPGSEQVDRALALLDQRDSRPFFLWLHLVEPHYRYERSPFVPSFGRDEQALYDAELAEADRQLGRLVAGLAERSLFEHTVLAVTGDHGEEFGEHGERFHATNLYEAQVRTALVLRIPGIGASRLRDAVVLTDLVPTLRTVLRLPSVTLGTGDGRDLVPYLLAGEPLKAGFFLENFRPENGGGRSTALVEWPFKLIYQEEGRTLELYDLERDPAERTNLHAAAPHTAGKLAEHLHARLESAVFSAIPPLP
jgi:arylsulfatase A-like enzyme